MTVLEKAGAMIDAIPSNVRGMFIMTLAAGIAASMHAVVRHTAETDMHPFEIFFFRQLIAIALLLPVFMKIGMDELKTERPYTHIARGAFQTVGGMTWFWALSILPLAKVTALNLSTALFAVLGAILFLGEKPDSKRTFALLFGFAGVMVVVRPGVEIISLGVVLVLASRIFSATGKVIAKSLAGTERTPTIVLYTACTIAVLSFIPSLFVWVWPTWEQMALICVIGFLGALVQLCIIRAYKLGDVGAVEPFSFFRLVFASLWGFVFFAEIPSIWIWVGGTMIVFAGSYLAKSENDAGRKAQKQHAAATPD
jgi:drug/metabolite transporter (DMT)-like permease